MKALAFDVGGTKIYNAIIDEKQKILSNVEKNATPQTFEQLRDLFKSVIEKYEDDVDVIAFSTCGAVNNQNTGIIGSTGNIAKDYPKMPFTQLSKKPVYVENDANCAAWAEHIIGASKGYANSLMLTLGTGVGGGIIVNNTLLKGKSGAIYTLCPDFQFKCKDGSYIILEHLGNLGDDKYAHDNMMKIQKYLDCGFVIGVNLFFTSDNAEGHTDETAIIDTLETIKKRMFR